MKTDVKERPILFSTEMVKAIIEGRKTQTRRIVEDCDTINDPRSIVSLTNGNSFAHFRFKGELTDFAGCVCKFGNIGDRLWVRETWGMCNEGLVYAASVCNPKYDKPKGGWKPSIHMPRIASRILLEITDIRVERLLEISEEDAIAEGVERVDVPNCNSAYKAYGVKRESCFVLGAHISFKRMWETIYGRDSVISNPFVWVVSFKVLDVKQ